MKFKFVTLFVSGSIWLGFGVWTFLFPETLSGVGLSVEGGLARTEIRAFYGGLECGIGLFLLWGSRAPSVQQIALVGALLAVGCTGLGRFLGIAMEGFETTLPMWTFLGIEVVGSGITLLALRQPNPPMNKEA